ncbi:MAG: hypothetical protein IJX24_08200 [Oscillospiraceae bacterium]|nr:hypothetical protein [Oscillospiraceae bacterium]
MEYSRSEIDFMRKDALRRTREMHSKAGGKSGDVQAEEPENIKQKSEKSFVSASKQQSVKSDPLSNIFSGLFSGGRMDNDRLIIIMLIIMLAREGADLKLLIALGYILM